MKSARELIDSYLSEAYGHRVGDVQLTYKGRSADSHLIAIRYSSKRYDVLVGKSHDINGAAISHLETNRRSPGSVLSVAKKSGETTIEVVLPGYASFTVKGT